MGSRGIGGMEDRVRIIDTGRPGRIGAPRHRLLPLDMAGPAEKLSRKGDGNDSFHEFTHRPGRTENAPTKPMAVAASLYGIGLPSNRQPGSLGVPSAWR